MPAAAARAEEDGPRTAPGSSAAADVMTEPDTSPISYHTSHITISTGDGGARNLGADAKLAGRRENGEGCGAVVLHDAGRPASGRRPDAGRSNREVPQNRDPRRATGGREARGQIAPKFRSGAGDPGLVVTRGGRPPWSTGGRPGRTAPPTPMPEQGGRVPKRRPPNRPERLGGHRAAAESP